MTPLKPVHKSIGCTSCQHRLRLIYLKNLRTSLHIVATYRERYNHLYVVLLTERSQRLDLRSIERAEDDVTFLKIGIAKKRGHVSCVANVPSIDISAYAILLQTVKSHEQATIIFDHAAAVAIVVM